MPAKELRRPLKPEAPDLCHEALTMALEILRERIGRLPQSDKDDLFELVKTLSWDDPEELESSVVTIARFWSSVRPVFAEWSSRLIRTSTAGH